MTIKWMQFWSGKKHTIENIKKGKQNLSEAEDEGLI